MAGEQVAQEGEKSEGIGRGAANRLGIRRQTLRQLEGETAMTTPELTPCDWTRSKSISLFRCG